MAEVKTQAEIEAEIADAAARAERTRVVEYLVARGVRRDAAVMYAEAFVEYRQAADNVTSNGTIVFHPKTGAPIENPFLVIRDKALKRLQAFRGKVAIAAEGLW